MKLKSKNISMIILLLLCLFMSGIITSAAEYHSTLRVGIYYGSDTVYSLTLDSDCGFEVGYSTGRDFHSLDKIQDTSVKVSKSPSGTYHLLYSSHGSAAELSSALKALRDSGINAFPAYYNSKYCAFGGTFANSNDAQWQAENGSVSATPVAVPQNAVQVTNAKTGRPIFVFSHDTYGLAVFSGNRQDDDSLISISGSAQGTYRGGFECKTLSANNLTVVNIVPTESYLYSVVGREMSPSWHVEALKAQAVCARNFALGRINYHSKYGFDVCRTVCCQAYHNQADKTASVRDAVDGTHGKLLFYQNEPAQTFYSSSMGSNTEDVKNVWGSSFPYLVSVDNPYEDTENITNGKWTKTLTTERATELMASYGIGTVTDISVLEYTDAGRVRKLLVKGTEGEKIFERDKCRTLFSGVTYSLKYTVTKGGVSTPPKAYVLSDTKPAEKTLNSVSVLSGNGSTVSISKKYAATDGKTTKTYETKTTGGDPDTYTFTGEGWGHSVGMSQYGAKGMAEAGFTYDKILTHYFSGTHIEQAY